MKLDLYIKAKHYQNLNCISFLKVLQFACLFLHLYFIKPFCFFVFGLPASNKRDNSPSKILIVIKTMRKLKKKSVNIYDCCEFLVASLQNLFTWNEWAIIFSSPVYSFSPCGVKNNYNCWLQELQASWKFGGKVEFQEQ